MLNIEKIRKDFGQKPDAAWFSSAGTSFIPPFLLEDTKNSLLQMQAEAYKGDVGFDDRVHREWTDAVGELINGDHDELAGVVCTTHGINLALYGFDLKPNDNIVIAELEYFAIPVAAYYHSRITGCEVRIAKREGAVIPPENIAALVDSNTKAIMISHVEFTNGFRNDLARLSSIAHGKNTLLVVDAIQSLGIVPIDVKAMDIDILISGAHKWISSLGGYGILFVKRDLIPKLRTSHLGYLGLADKHVVKHDYISSLDFVKEYPIDENEVRKFEFSTENLAGKIAMTKVIRYFLDIGIEVVEKRVLDLGDYLIEGLEKKGIKIRSPLKREQRSGIINIAPTGNNVEIAKRLKSKGIFTQPRGGGIRVAINLYNTEEELDRLLNAL